MIYTVINESRGYEASIDDTMLFDSYPKAFQDLFNELRVNDIAEFDNCTAMIMPTGRVLFTKKTEDNGTI